MCPSTTIKIINFLLKKVKFTNKFFSVYWIFPCVLEYPLEYFILNILLIIHLSICSWWISWMSSWAPALNYPLEYPLECYTYRTFSWVLPLEYPIDYPLECLSCKFSWVFPLEYPLECLFLLSSWIFALNYPLDYPLEYPLDYLSCRFSWVFPREYLLQCLLLIILLWICSSISAWISSWVGYVLDLLFIQTRRLWKAGSRRRSRQTCSCALLELKTDLRACIFMICCLKTDNTMAKSTLIYVRLFCLWELDYTYYLYILNSSLYKGLSKCETFCIEHYMGKSL